MSCRRHSRQIGLLVLAAAVSGGAGNAAWSQTPPPAGYAIQWLGLTGDAYQHDVGGGHYERDTWAVSLTSAGRVIGHSRRYHAESGDEIGQDAWLHNATLATRIGLVGDGYEAKTDGSFNRRVSWASSLNDGGKAVGDSYRYNFSSGDDRGSDAWYFDGAATTMLGGLTGADYQYDIGGETYRQSWAGFINNAGHIVGGTARYSASGGNLGQDVWTYHGSSPTRIGLMGSEYEDDTGSGIRRESEVAALNEAGSVIGRTKRYDAMGDYGGYDAWLYDWTSMTTTQLGLIGAGYQYDLGSEPFRNSTPITLNEAGQAIGQCYRFSALGDGLGRDAWYFDGTSNMPVGLIGPGHQVNTSAGIYRYGAAAALNQFGQVAGYSARFSTATDTWLGYDAWRFDGAMHHLLPGLAGEVYEREVGGESFHHSEASYLNSAGQVVGWSARYDAAGGSLGEAGWFYDPSTGVTTELAFSFRSTDNFSLTEPSLLTDAGVVLGSYALFTGSSFKGERAFWWSADAGFRDLGELVAGGLTAEGWSHLASAYRSGGPDSLPGHSPLHIVGTGALLDQSAGECAYLLTAISAPTLPGDYNGDGSVDAADYVVWRKTDGTQAGYDTWRAHFGQHAGSGAILAADSSRHRNTAIPEPATWPLLMIGGAMIVWRTQRTHRGIWPARRLALGLRLLLQSIGVATLLPVTAQSGSFTDDFTGGINGARWTVFQSTAGMYTVDDTDDCVKLDFVGPNPSYFQRVRLNLIIPSVTGAVVSTIDGDFSVSVEFSNAVLGPGVDQVELQVGFSDAKYFYAVRDNSPEGGDHNVHVWTGSFITGFNTTVVDGTLRIARTDDDISAYLGNQLIATVNDYTSNTINSIGFALQNNHGSNDHASVTFDSFLLEANGVALPGDYNGDGSVDAADYVVWRKGLGTTYTPADYDVWRAHFGQTVGSGAVVGANSSSRADAAIPEPVTLWLAMLGAAATLSSFGRRFMRCGAHTLAVQPCSLRRAAATESQLVARIVWPGLIVLISLVAGPCLHPAVAGTIPAAQYHGRIDYYDVTRVETFKEGSISYDYQGEGAQFVASVQLTGGNALTVDVQGDYQRGPNSPNPDATAFGSLRYFFAVSKKDPQAPDTPVPFLISAKAHASAQKTANGTRSPFARAYVSYKHPYATNYEILLTATAETAGSSRVTVDRTFEGLRAQPPGTIGTIAVVAEGSARQISYSEWAAGSFQAIADPYIRIDPTYTVLVNGVPRLATEVYGLEFSEGIGSGIPEPATLVLLLVGGGCLELQRHLSRRARSRTSYCQSVDFPGGVPCNASQL